MTLQNINVRQDINKFPTKYPELLPDCIVKTFPAGLADNRQQSSLLLLGHTLRGNQIKETLISYLVGCYQAALSSQCCGVMSDGDKNIPSPSI